MAGDDRGSVSQAAAETMSIWGRRVTLGGLGAQSGQLPSDSGPRAEARLAGAPPQYHVHGGAEDGAVYDCMDVSWAEDESEAAVLKRVNGGKRSNTSHAQLSTNAQTAAAATSVTHNVALPGHVAALLPVMAALSTHGGPFCAQRRSSMSGCSTRPCACGCTMWHRSCQAAALSARPPQPAALQVSYFDGL